jgi:hypothetical protein
MEDRMATTKKIEISRSLAAKLLGKTGSKRRRALSYAGREARTNKTGMVGLLIGAAVAYFVSLDSVKKSEWLTKNWWFLPLVLAVGGYMLHKRGSPYGAPLMVLGGYVGIQAYQNRPAPAGTTPIVKSNTQGPELATGGTTFALPAGMAILNVNGQQVMLPASQVGAYTAPANDPALSLASQVYGRRAAA